MTADTLAPIITGAVPGRIPALSIWRPWTTCITRYSKSIENRGWSTKYRGPIWIHGAKRFDVEALGFASRLGIGLSADPGDHPTGVVALAQLVDICSPWDWSLTGDAGCDCDSWAVEGQHHWQLANVQELPDPVPCNGRQGLWWPTGDLRTTLDAALAGGQVA